MSRKSERSKIKLDENQRIELLKISQSRTAAIREVQRARILLNYSDGESQYKQRAEYKLTNYL